MSVDVSIKSIYLHNCKLNVTFELYECREMCLLKNEKTKEENYKQIQLTLSISHESNMCFRVILTLIHHKL